MILGMEFFFFIWKIFRFQTRGYKVDKKFLKSVYCVSVYDEVFFNEFHSKVSFKKIHSIIM